MPYDVQDLYPDQAPAAQAEAGSAGGMLSEAQAAQAAGPSDRTASNASASTAAADGARATEGSSAATGYNAQTGEIDPSTMTAAGQMANITGNDSPLMRRAQQEGLLAAGRRGLENSSIAVGNSMGAMADRATPLAQQDANTYYQNLRANVDARNRASEVSTGRETDVSMLNSQMATDVAKANAKAENDINMLNAQLETAVSQQNAAEQNRIQAQIAELQNQVAIRNAELETQTNMANASDANRAAMLDAELETQTGQFNAQQRNQMTIDTQAMINDLNKQYMVGEQQVDLANVQGRYQQLISSNAAAGAMYDSYLQGLANIMQNKDIKPDRVAAYVNVMSRQLEGGLEFIDAINALDAGVNLDLPGASTTGQTTIYPTGGGLNSPYPDPTAPPPVTAPTGPYTGPSPSYDPADYGM